MSAKLAVQTPEDHLLGQWKMSLDLSLAAGEYTTSTCQAYQRGMGKFLAWCQENEIEQVSANTIRRWIADGREQGFKPTSINSWYAGVRAFFSWAVGNGLLAHNPTEGVKGVKRRGVGKKHLRDPLTDREMLRLLQQPDISTPEGKRDHAILCLMAFTAMRTVEIQRADVDDLSTVDGLPVLRVQGKGSREKDEMVVVAHAKAQEAVYEWLAVREDVPGVDIDAMFVSLSDRNRGKRISTSGIRHQINAYMKRAGIVERRKTTHSIRHAAISKVAGRDVLKARQVARHASLDTTMIYVHENDRLTNPGEAFIDYQNDTNGNGESETGP